MLPLSDYMQAFVGILAILGPFSAMPIFVTLTANKTRKEKNELVKSSVINATIVALCSIWLGSIILNFFNIGIPAFRVAGGILLLTLAISMINAKVPGAKQTPEELAEAKISHKDLALIPLAIPLITGPGAISTIIVFTNYSSGFLHLLIMSFIVLVIMLYVYTSLKMAAYLSDKLGLIGINVISRIMGIILASIAIEFMASGLTILFPGWS